MTRRHQLETTLRTLKLSGMLDTLEARLAQARAGELGHLEFLQVLCEDEITRRDAAALDPPGPPGPLRAGRHPRGLRLRLQPEDPRRRTSATSPPCASSTPTSRSSSTAPSGSARPISPKPSATTPAGAATRAVFTKTSRLLADLAGGHADRTWGARLRRWARPDVLILDDFAMRDFTAAQADDLYELITERQTRGSLDPHLQPRPPSTGIRCSPTPSSPSASSTGSSTPPTTSTWTAAATAPTSDPVDRRPRKEPPPTRTSHRNRLRESVNDTPVDYVGVDT